MMIPLTPQLPTFRQTSLFVVQGLISEDLSDRGRLLNQPWRQSSLLKRRLKVTIVSNPPWQEQ
jgi:hypothetical protein